MIYEKIKRLADELLRDHADNGAWDKWARRFIMGIDKTKEASEKALKYNESKFKERSGTDRATLDCYYELIDESNAYYCPFIARSCLCRAAVAWAKADGIRGVTALNLAKEAEEELTRARNSLDCLP